MVALKKLVKRLCHSPGAGSSGVVGCKQRIEGKKFSSSFLIFQRVSWCSPCCPRNHSVDQAILILRDPPAPLLPGCWDCKHAAPPPTHPARETISCKLDLESEREESEMTRVLGWSSWKDKVPVIEIKNVYRGS